MNIDTGNIIKQPIQARHHPSSREEAAIAVPVARRWRCGRAERFPAGEEAVANLAPWLPWYSNVASPVTTNTQAAAITIKSRCQPFKVTSFSSAAWSARHIEREPPAGLYVSNYTL